MKLFNLVVFFLIFLLVCCTKKQEYPSKESNSVAEKDTVTATLYYNVGSLPASPFRIDSVKVSEKKKNHLRFFNNTDYNATFVIPNSDKLFKKNLGYASHTDSVSNIQYLFIPLQAQGKSEKFKISENANPDNKVKVIYPFSVFCDDGTQAAERNSSPIIIVDP
ncbi:hypothetical protein ACFLSX_04205 [Calditrichota bacterium]